MNHQFQEGRVPGVNSSGPSTLVDIKDLRFSYPDGTLALDQVNLSIAKGGVLGLCGPSGCGKSTLLSLLAGIHEPTSGTITWNSEPEDAGQHPLTMVFQKDTLLPWKTAEENVGLFDKLNHRKPTGIVDELLEMVGLEGFRKAYPNRLSGGMRRRLQFITAMAAQPQMILLDEPFSALDEPTRVAIHQDVLGIVRRLGTTVVVVTHDLAEAASLCDEVIVFSSRPGRVAAKHTVPFGAERNVMELRTSPEYLELYGKLWDDLSAQIASGQPKEAA